VCYIQGKCVGFRAKPVAISGHLPPAYFAESSALSGKRLALFGDGTSSSGDGRIAFDNNHNARWFLAENDSFARRVLKDFPWLHVASHTEKKHVTYGLFCFL